MRIRQKNLLILCGVYVCLCGCAFVCVCGPATEAINLWHDMDSNCLDNRLLQLLNSSYGCIVSIISRCGLVV